MNVYPANPPNIDLSITKPVAEQLALDISEEMNARIAADNELREMIEELEPSYQGIGVAGFNLYPSVLDSDIVGYDTLSVTPDATETEVAVSATAETVWGPSYLSSSQLGITEIPAGEWAFTYFRKVSSSALSTKAVAQIFLRHADTTETVVVYFESPEVDNIDYEQRFVAYVEEAISCAESDRFGIRLGVSTNRAVETTLTYIVGDGRAFYVRTPLVMSHNNLTGRDSNDAHPQSAITNLESDLLPASLLTKIKTVDGTGSGLDSDLLDGANLSLDSTLSGNSDSLIPSQKAIKAYIDTQIKARVMPVGSIYLQLPTQATPSSVFSGTTWSDVSSLYAGLFFRVEGGSASAFGSGTQSAQNLSHTHTNSVNNQSTSHTHSGTTGSESADHTHSIVMGSHSHALLMRADGSPNGVLDDGYPPIAETYSANHTSDVAISSTDLGTKVSGGRSASHSHTITTGSQSASHNHTVTINSEGGADLRPINTTVRVWKRTA